MALSDGLTADSFNSQPPEGGWLEHMARALKLTGFNSQPPEGGWAGRGMGGCCLPVSTHSRPKAAGFGGM